MTALADAHGVSRQHVYDLRERARDALITEFTPASSPRSGVNRLVVGDADIERVIVALRVVTPASVRDIVEVLPELCGVRWSYGSVWNVLHRAEQCAGERLRDIDLSAMQGVALDEMFSQGRPVLAGVDLDTQYLFALTVNDSRSGQAWASLLEPLRDEQSLNPAHVVKDAGTGLAAGVRQCWPDANENDDLFHATYLTTQAAGRLERAAYQALEVVEALTEKRARARTETERRSLGQRLRQATDHMDAAIARYDRFEALREEAFRVLQLADRGSGRLRTAAEVESTLKHVAAEMQGIGGKRIGVVARYLGNRAAGLGRYLDDLGHRLDTLAVELGGREVVEAATRAYQACLDIKRGGRPWDRRARREELRDAVRHLREVTGNAPARLTQVVGTVLPELARRYRASSAIENVNSVLRPYLVVQKHAEQGFLDLFRFYWNTRTRAWGRWKGTSAHEQLTGERVEDWLTLLGFPRSEARAAAA